MSCYGRSKKILLVLITIFGLLVFSAEVMAANIKRSCSANYYGMIKNIKFIVNNHERTLNVPFETINIGYQDNKFSAQAGCGKLVPNRCRKRARNKLLACAKAHVNSPNETPGVCRPNTLKSYPIQDLISMIKEKACGRLISRDGIRVTDLLSKPYEVEILLGVSIRGKDRCGKEKPGKTEVDGQRYSIEGNMLFLRQPLKSFTLTCS